MKLDLIGVPTNSAGRKDGLAKMPEALRQAGLVETLGRAFNVSDKGDVAFSTPTTERDPASGIIAPGSLASMILGVRSAVGQAFREDRFPLVIGGDCPVLLGCLVACKEQGGRTGLLFVDGHEDAYPAHQSPTGEAADMELGFALGFDVPEQMQKDIGLEPLVQASNVCIMGARDKGVLLKTGVRSLDGTVELYSDSDLLKNGIESLTEKTVGKLSRNTDRLWLHVDLDVLSTESLPAVDYQQPGGINWEQLETLAKTAFSSGRIAGCNVTIYNPDMDPDGRHARRIVKFLENALLQ
jgi:arginase